MRTTKTGCVTAVLEVASPIPFSQWIIHSNHCRNNNNLNKINLVLKEKARFDKTHSNTFQEHYKRRGLHFEYIVYGGGPKIKSLIGPRLPELTWRSTYFRLRLSDKQTRKSCERKQLSVSSSRQCQKSMSQSPRLLLQAYFTTLFCHTQLSCGRAERESSRFWQVM